jgi:hypothetical protein
MPVTWLKRSNLVRRKEINVIKATSYIRGVTMSFIIFTTRMSLFITVLAYVLSGFQITAEKVFMMTAYYNILRTTMTVFFPQGNHSVFPMNILCLRCLSLELGDQ